MCSNYDKENPLYCTNVVKINREKICKSRMRLALKWCPYLQRCVVLAMRRVQSFSQASGVKCLEIIHGDEIFLEAFSGKPYSTDT